MFIIHDIRESRVWQDAFKEGFEDGLKKGMMIVAARLAASKMPAEVIADILEFDVELVRQAIANVEQN
jgi:hypothetical protein